MFWVERDEGAATSGALGGVYMPSQVWHEKFIGLFFYSLDAMARGMNHMKQKSVAVVLFSQTSILISLGLWD